MSLSISTCELENIPYWVQKLQDELQSGNILLSIRFREKQPPGYLGRWDFRVSVFYRHSNILSVLALSHTFALNVYDAFNFWAVIAETSMVLIIPTGLPDSPLPHQLVLWSSKTLTFCSNFTKFWQLFLFLYMWQETLRLHICFILLLSF